jgi:hypothetical protein
MPVNQTGSKGVKSCFAGMFAGLKKRSAAACHAHYQGGNCQMRCVPAAGLSRAHAIRY